MSLELDLETAGVAAVSAAMASGATTSAELVEALPRPDRRASDPLVNAVRCLAPDAHERAAALDAERRDGRVRGPLHGVPVLVKDNIDVAGLPTTAGALALEHSVPDRDAELVVRLREAGAVVIGKTNLTEMANCMAENMPSGYSSLGGQVLNPYDVSRTPERLELRVRGGGGAGAGHRHRRHRDRRVDPESRQLPEPGRTQADARPGARQAASCPIATSQDCAGPMCRTVADAAALLGVLTGESYGEGSGPDTLRGVRLAVPPRARRPARAGCRGVPTPRSTCCATAVPSSSRCRRCRRPTSSPVLLHEFARDLDAYLATLPEGAPIRTMRELVAWNEAHADEALKYGQVLLEKALAVDHDAERAAYELQRARDLAVAGEHGIDATLAVRRRRGHRVPGPGTAAATRRAPGIRAWWCRPATAGRTAGRSA